MIGESGALVGARYRLIECLGRGAVGGVHRAHDERFDREVAVKLFHGKGFRKEEDRLRLRREVEAWARLRHPNVVRLLDCDVDEHLGPFVTMEYVAGPTLETLLARRGPLPPQEVAGFLIDLARGLEAIHGASLVHRDLSSRNVLIAEGRAVICDFGLVLDELATRITETGTVLGTPCYLAPEVLQGDEASIRSDVYQFGVLAFEMLTGRTPWEEKTLGPLFEEIVAAGVPRPSALRPCLDVAWDDLVARCMARRPEHRPAGLRPLGAELEALAIPPVSRKATAHAPVGADRGRRTAMRRVAWRMAGGLSGIVALLLLGVGALRVERSIPRGTTETAPSGIHLLEASATDETIVVTCGAPLSEDLAMYVRRGEILDPVRFTREDGTGAVRLTVATSALLEDVVIAVDGRRHSLAERISGAVDVLARRLKGFPVDSTFFPATRVAFQPFRRDIASAFASSEEERVRIKRDYRATIAREARQRLETGLSASYREAYRQAVGLSSAVSRLSAVSPEMRQRLYEAMDPGRRVELWAAIQEVDLKLGDRSPWDLREPRRSATGGASRIVDVFDGSSVVVLRQPRRPGDDSKGSRFDHPFDVPTLRGLAWAEMAFDTDVFRDLTVCIRVNGTLAGRLYVQPWLPMAESDTLYVSIPPFLLKEGANHLRLETELLVSRRIGARIRLRGIRLRMGQ